MNNVVCFAPIVLATVLGVPSEDRERFWQESLRIREHVNELPRIERQVIAWLFGLFGPDLSVGEVAKRLRLTPEAVVRIEERALAQLRWMHGGTSIFVEAA